MLPHVLEDSFIGLVEQSSKFLTPVYRGDTVYPSLEIIELIPGKTTVHNQEGELVMEGEQKCLSESDHLISRPVCRLRCVRLQELRRYHSGRPGTGK
jgi:hypothetical protein